jgi:hypothetical protein
MGKKGLAAPECRLAIANWLLKNAESAPNLNKK